MNKVKDSNQNIAKAVLKIRQDNKLSQEQFAEMVGVTRQAVSRWEMGGPKLKDTTLKTHAYITSKQYNFGGKPYEKADFLRI